MAPTRRLKKMHTAPFKPLEGMLGAYLSFTLAEADLEPRKRMSTPLQRQKQLPAPPYSRTYRRANRNRRDCHFPYYKPTYRGAIKNRLERACMLTVPGHLRGGNEGLYGDNC